MSTMVYCSWLPRCCRHTLEQTINNIFHSHMHALKHQRQCQRHTQTQDHEKRKSFKTGEPANSGFSKTQLLIGQPIYASFVIDKQT
jgi:hypothetical protein